MVFNKIDNDSANSITSALDFFTIPPTNTSVASSSWREYLTLNPITDIPYHFKVYSSNNYLDLSKVYVLSEFRIKKLGDNGNWVNIAATDNVASINNIGSSFIKNVKVSFNGREISDTNSLYAFKSYLDTELSLPKSTKDSYLSVAGYYSEKRQQDSTDEGFIARKALFEGSKTAQFIAKLDVDIFNQPNYLVSGVEVAIEIMPNESNFCILEPNSTDINYKFEIMNLRLYVKSLELMSGLAYDISQKLEKIPARYAIRRTSIKSTYISENRTEFTSLLWSEQIPRRIVLAMVSNEAYIGSKNKSPFNFQHFNVRELTIFANGKNYPNNLYNLNFTTNHYARAFHDTCEALGFANSVETNGINMDKFKNGWSVYVFNLTNSGEDNPCFDLISEGSCTVNIKFSQHVPDGGIVLLALAEFDSILYIDSNKSVVSDYNA